MIDIASHSKPLPAIAAGGALPARFGDPNAPPVDVEHEGASGCVLVAFERDLSIRNTDQSLLHLTEAMDRSAEIVVDFAAVDSCDAAGLQLICSLARTISEHASHCRIAALSPAIEAAAAALGLPPGSLSGTHPNSTRDMPYGL